MSGNKTKKVVKNFALAIIKFCEDIPKKEIIQGFSDEQLDAIVKIQILLSQTIDEMEKLV